MGWGFLIFADTTAGAAFHRPSRLAVPGDPVRVPPLTRPHDGPCARRELISEGRLFVLARSRTDRHLGAARKRPVISMIPVPIDRFRRHLARRRLLVLGILAHVQEVVALRCFCNQSALWCGTSSGARRNRRRNR